MGKNDPKVTITKHQGKYYDETPSYDIMKPDSQLPPDPRSESEKVDDACHDAACSMRNRPAPNAKKSY